jgi:hypothetical protein
MQKLSIEQNPPESVTNNEKCQETKEEKILCQHCGRTANNEIKCKGICVADSDY